MVNCGVPPLGTTALTSTTFPSFSSPTLESSYNTIFTTRSLCQALPHRIPLLEGRYHLLSQESQAPVHGFLGEEPAGFSSAVIPVIPSISWNWFKRSITLSGLPKTTLVSRRS